MRRPFLVLLMAALAVGCGSTDASTSPKGSIVTTVSIAPHSAQTTGGVPVAITGSGFAAAATVTVGGTAATNVQVVSATSITATVPAHAAGKVDVVVTNSDAGTGTLTGGFTYANLAGTWTGTTGQGKAISFVVDSTNALTKLTYTFTPAATGCNDAVGGATYSPGVDVSSNAFNSSQTTLVFSGTLSSTTSASGSLVVTIATGSCAGTVTTAWTATKG